LRKALPHRRPVNNAKEHLNMVFVTWRWTGQPITKIVLANKYRMLVPKNFVKMHVTPSVSPSP
jgi:hypothetical protein